MFHFDIQLHSLSEIHGAVGNTECKLFSTLTFNFNFCDIHGAVGNTECKLFSTWTLNFTVLVKITVLSEILNEVIFSTLTFNFTVLVKFTMLSEILNVSYFPH